MNSRVNHTPLLQRVLSFSIQWGLKTDGFAMGLAIVCRGETLFCSFCVIADPIVQSKRALARACEAGVPSMESDGMEILLEVPDHSVSSSRTDPRSRRMSHPHVPVAFSVEMEPADDSSDDDDDILGGTPLIDLSGLEAHVAKLRSTTRDIPSTSSRRPLPHAPAGATATAAAPAHFQEPVSLESLLESASEWGTSLDTFLQSLKRWKQSLDLLESAVGSSVDSVGRETQKQFESLMPAIDAVPAVARLLLYHWMEVCRQKADLDSRGVTVRSQIQRDQLEALVKLRLSLRGQAERHLLDAFSAESALKPLHDDIESLSSVASGLSSTLQSIAHKLRRLGEQGQLDSLLREVDGTLHTLETAESTPSKLGQGPDVVLVITACDRLVDAHQKALAAISREPAQASPGPASRAQASPGPASHLGGGGLSTRLRALEEQSHRMAAIDASEMALDNWEAEAQSSLRQAELARDRAIRTAESAQRALDALASSATLDGGGKDSDPSEALSLLISERDRTILESEREYQRWISRARDALSKARTETRRRSEQARTLAHELLADPKIAEAILQVREASRSIRAVLVRLAKAQDELLEERSARREHAHTAMEDAARDAFATTRDRIAESGKALGKAWEVRASGKAQDIASAQKRAWAELQSASGASFSQVGRLAVELQRLVEQVAWETTRSLEHKASSQLADNLIAIVQNPTTAAT